MICDSLAAKNWRCHNSTIWTWFMNCKIMQFGGVAQFIDCDESIQEWFSPCLLLKWEVRFVPIFFQQTGLISAVKILKMFLLSTYKKHWERHITCLPCEQLWHIGGVLIQCFASNDFSINGNGHFTTFCEKPENCHIHQLWAWCFVKKLGENVVLW